VRRIQTLNRVLWGLNVLLAAVALILAGRPSQVDRPGDLDLPAAAPAPSLPHTLNGALPAEQHGGVAFIQADGRESIAVKGEEVHGWRLYDLWKDRATFVGPTGQRTEVVIEPFGPSATHR
jgi:hypothetical protein